MNLGRSSFTQKKLNTFLLADVNMLCVTRGSPDVLSTFLYLSPSAVLARAGEEFAVLPQLDFALLQQCPVLWPRCADVYTVIKGCPVTPREALGCLFSSSTKRE